MIINKTMMPGESKVEKYSHIADELILTAKKEKVDKIRLSSEFVPILAFSKVERKPLTEITGEYLYGSYNDINIYICPDYIKSGKIGNINIELQS